MTGTTQSTVMMVLTPSDVRTTDRGDILIPMKQSDGDDTEHCDDGPDTE